MADFDLNIKFRADKLGKQLEGISDQIQSELNDAISDLAHSAYANIVADVQTNINNQDFRQEYLKGLRIDQIGDGQFVISLDGEWANKLEDGFPSYDLKAALLKSKKKVAVGKRAGGDWVQKTADGTRFAHVPFQTRPSSKAVSGDLKSDIAKIKAENASGRQQRITQTFKSEEGKPLSGRVAQGRSNNPMLDRITKYQRVSPTSGKVDSLYINYRTVSDNSSGWKHPGHEGYMFFGKAEKYIEDQLDSIIETLL